MSSFVVCICGYSKPKSVLGQPQSLFSTQRKIAQDKKMPLRFNYPSWLPLIRKKMYCSSAFLPWPRHLYLLLFFLPVVNRSLKMNCFSFLFPPCTLKSFSLRHRCANVVMEPRREINLTLPMSVFQLMYICLIPDFSLTGMEVSIMEWFSDPQCSPSTASFIGH